MGARKAVFLVDAAGGVTPLLVQDDAPLCCGSYFPLKLRRWLAKRDPGAWEADLRWEEGLFAPVHVHVTRRVDPERYASMHERELHSFAAALKQHAGRLGIRGWSEEQAAEDAEERRRTTAAATVALKRDLKRNYRAQCMLGTTLGNIYYAARRNPGVVMSREGAALALKAAESMVASLDGNGSGRANHRTVARHMLRWAVETGWTKMPRSDSDRLLALCGC
jgi:hypothetical protein